MPRWPRRSCPHSISIPLAILGILAAAVVMTRLQLPAQEKNTNDAHNKKNQKQRTCHANANGSRRENQARPLKTTPLLVVFAAARGVCRQENEKTTTRKATHAVAPGIKRGNLGSQYLQNELAAQSDVPNKRLQALRWTALGRPPPSPKALHRHHASPWPPDSARLKENG